MQQSHSLDLRSRSRRSAWALAITLAFWAAPLGLAAQTTTPQVRPWVFSTRVIATGSSDESEPAGYKVYSAFSIEAGLRRRLTRALGVELAVRTESREVDSLFPPGEDRRLGSLELLPIDLLLQLHLPTGGSVHPYAGAGVNLTVAWEKSGVLDSLDMPGSVGPALQVGTDVDLSSYALLNVDLRWNTLRAELDNAGTRFTRLKIDPVSLGIGVGFRF